MITFNSSHRVNNTKLHLPLWMKFIKIVFIQVKT